MKGQLLLRQQVSEMDGFSKVLVTGGAGFIGSHLIDGLMSRGFCVRVVDNLSNGNIRNLESWLDDPRFEFVRGDLKNPKVALRSVDDVGMVFHLAANSEVRMGETGPSVLFDENLLVTFNLLEAMRKSEKAKLMVFASSSLFTVSRIGFRLLKVMCFFCRFLFMGRLNLGVNR